jgi:hypothetical protein
MVSYGLSRLNHGCFFCCLCVVVIVIFPLIMQWQEVKDWGEEQVGRQELVLHNMDFRCTWFTHLFLLLSHRTFFSLSNTSSLCIKEGKELIMSMWTLFMACEFHIYLCIWWIASFKIHCALSNPICLIIWFLGWGEYLILELCSNVLFFHVL